MQSEAVVYRFEIAGEPVRLYADMKRAGDDLGARCARLLARADAAGAPIVTCVERRGGAPARAWFFGADGERAPSLDDLGWLHCFQVALALDELARRPQSGERSSMEVSRDVVTSTGTFSYCAHSHRTGNHAEIRDGAGRVLGERDWMGAIVSRGDDWLRRTGELMVSLGAL